MTRHCRWRTLTTQEQDSYINRPPLWSVRIWQTMHVVDFCSESGQAGQHVHERFWTVKSRKETGCNQKPEQMGNTVEGRTNLHRFQKPFASTDGSEELMIDFEITLKDFGKRQTFRDTRKG